jgi:hypothetical protein
MDCVVGPNGKFCPQKALEWENADKIFTSGRCFDNFDESTLWSK